MSKIKIAILMNAFWNNGKGTSGGDQRITQIFKRLGAFFEIDIYTTEDGKKLVASDIQANFIISPRDFDNKSLIKSYYLKTKWASKKMLEKKYDVIYSSSDFFPDVIPASSYVSKNTQTKWIQVVHHIYPNWKKRPGNKIKNFAAKFLQDLSFSYIKKNANLVITVSEKVKKELVEKCFFKKNIAVNHNGIDVDFFDSIKTNKIKNRVTFLARLNPSKGIFDIAQIWSKVIKKNPAEKLEIIGSGPTEIVKKLQDEIKNKKLNDSITLHGFLPNDQAFKILKSSEIFISPSHEEGFGIAVGEAMAAKCAVICWDLSIYKNIFEDKIITISENDIDGFANSIIVLMNDPDKIKKYADLGYNYIKKYNWGNISKKEYQFIKSTYEEKNIS
jgi:glycosyltransferase involved in cell wall biosynthesis